MKTAMQELLEWLETPAIWGENNFSVKSKVNQLLEKEKTQIMKAFDDGDVSVGIDGKVYYDKKYTCDYGGETLLSTVKPEPLI